MAVSTETVMAIKTYQNQAEALVKNYLLADPFIPYTSVLGGIFACKVVTVSPFRSFWTWELLPDQH
jgi:hypothetical protein